VRAESGISSLERDVALGSVGSGEAGER